MVLRLLAHNAEHWLSNQLNAYLRDDDEYRAITRETIIRGTAGLIGFAPEAITVTLQQPGETRVARALALLIDEILSAAFSSSQRYHRGRPRRRRVRPAWRASRRAGWRGRVGSAQARRKAAAQP